MLAANLLAVAQSVQAAELDSASQEAASSENAVDFLGKTDGQERVATTRYGSVPMALKTLWTKPQTPQATPAEMGATRPRAGESQPAVSFLNDPNEEMATVKQADRALRATRTAGCAHGAIRRFFNADSIFRDSCGA